MELPMGEMKGDGDEGIPEILVAALAEHGIEQERLVSWELKRLPGDSYTVRYQAKVLLRPVAPEEIKIDIVRSRDPE